MPKTSILMPVYNEEKYLAESIESIISQTYNDFELLILDDNSTDKSMKIIEKYSKMDSRIKFIPNKKRIGYTNSLNILLKESKGEYVCILGSDDIFMPNRLEVAVKFHEEHPEIGATYSDYYWIDEKGSTMRRVDCIEYDLKMLMMSEYINVTTMMIRKSCLEEIGGFDEELKLSQDSLMKFEIGHRFGMVRIPDALVKYRIRGGSITTANPEEQNKYLEMAKRKFKEKHPEFKETWITVGVPVYNPNMKYLKECLDSINKQTYKNYEVVVIDDGSENREEVESFVKQYGFKYFYQKNKGIGRARNAIIDKMSDDSDYLCQLSQDDIMHQEYLKTMCQVAKGADKSIIHTNFLIINEQGNAAMEYKVPQFETVEDSRICCLAFAERNTMFVNFSTTFFPAEIVKKERFDDEFRYGEDLEFLLRTSIVKKYTYVHVPEFLVKVRMHEGSMTTKKNNDIPENNAKILKKIGEMMGW